jgi:hypothetical protein
MDQIRGGADSAVFFDPWAREYSDGLRDLVDKVSTDMLGTGLTAPTGLQGWIDSSGTIAGILRSTYTWFAAYEDNAAGTTIAIADLNTHDYIVRDAERGGMINLWITSPKQKAKWAAVCGFIGASGNSLNIQVGANGATFNSGWNWDGAKHGNAPIVDVPDLTNSVWLGLTTEHWLIARQRAVSVVQLGIMGDQVKFLVTCAYGLVCRSPKKQAKILNLTA